MTAALIGIPRRAGYVSSDTHMITNQAKGADALAEANLKRF